MLYTTLLNRISETYSSLTRLYSLKLIVVDDVVFVKGLNKAEIEQSEASVLRGLLQITVNRNAVPISSIDIKFIGQTRDVIFFRDAHLRRFLHMNGKTTLNDCYKYTTGCSQLLKGVYTFPFQFSIDPNTPESISSALGSKSYHLEVGIETGSNTEYFKPIFRPITLIRVPCEASLLPSDCISSTGNWKGKMNYHICVHSKVCKLGGNITISLDTTPITSLNQFGIVKYAKVHFVQKTKCPSFPINSSDLPYTNEQKELLYTHNFKKKKHDWKQIEEQWEVKVPKTMRFKVYPFNSNNQQDLELPSMKIIHYLTITLGIETNEFDSDEQMDHRDSKHEKFKVNHTLNELVFKTQIYLLNPLVEIYSSPPAYTDQDSFIQVTSVPKPERNFSEDRTTTKSSTWLCTNGRYEYEMPPKYEMAS